MVEVIAQRQWIFGARQLGMRLRVALISHIYKKGLHLSSQSRQSHSSGEIINYMSVDIQRITDFIWYMNTIWMLPIQISLATYILNMNVGLGSYAGLAATLLVMACNIPLTRIQKRFQSKIMEAKDDRMKATSEVLRNMKTLKLQAWDMKYLLKLENLRKIEYNWLWKSLRLSALSAFISCGSPTFISVVTFGACILMGIPLTAGKVISALATFRMLQNPIFSLPDLLSVVAQAKVSVDRVASYLQEDEIQEDAVMFVPRDASGVEIEIENGKFSWDTESSKPTLDGIQLTVKRGMKVAICGTVGSGKSSLLSCILGEIPKLSGTVKISGTKAYVPQSPWILTGNVRDNILFGNPYDSVKYDRTIRACALTKDFELFSCGDLTEIGERGINMSGGQKQRIQIARAVYQDADIYFLDDPFSAVDAHTGTQLFEDCLMGILKDKTILYVTHQVEFLPAADLILMMQDGQIKQAGKFEQLLKYNIGFEVLVGAHSEALESILNVENSRGRLTQKEEREKGSIGKEVYWSYLTLVWGGAFVPITVLAESSFHVLQISSNYWMAWASPPTMDTEPVVGMNVLFLVYTLLSVGSSLCVLVRATLVATVGILTSQKLFMNMLHSVIRAPMSFFDSTPTGRILNRASTDQSVLDLELPMKVGWCAISIIEILGTIGVMSQVAWQVFVIFIPVTAICIWYQQYYTPTARELARLSGIQRAPILHHFAESLTGAATIRAYDQENRFIDTNLGLVDNDSRPWFHNVSAMEWLSFRLNLLSNFVFAASLVVLVRLPEGIINPSIAGLAVTYGLNLNVLQANVIWKLCNAENKMTSVERILQYSKLTSEAPLEIEECRPPSNWPEFGKICFKNLQIRYAEQLPSVLKNINCTIPGRKKVGVVGRTGSGKSTLIQALFRTVEPREGSILIDDVDICKIGLHDLRSRLSIIPQDPTMFEGTVRGNLDPLEQFSDEEIWEALDKCQLGDIVRAKEEKLDSPVVENGENWSMGQRQLFCLGRALLKRSSILVLDEATASVDSATDGIVQKIISREFKNRTVVTIAHRIHTVIDSDLVLVLSEAGRVVEYDTPTKLLEREDSFFSKLIKEYSLRSKNFNSLSNLQNVENKLVFRSVLHEFGPKSNSSSLFERKFQKIKNRSHTFFVFSVSFSFSHLVSLSFFLRGTTSSSSSPSLTRYLSHSFSHYFELLEDWKARLQLSSPCFWEELSILLQLGLLGIILICFVQRRCTQRSRVTEEGAQKYPISVKLGFSYKATVGCSVLLLGSHFLMLLMLLNGEEALCKSKISVLSEETLQVMLFLVTLLLVFNLWKSRSLKLPWILRAWWISSFLLSVIHTILDAHYILTNHRSPGLRDYANFLSLIASTYLLGVSVRGTTGISFLAGSITDPLLNKTGNNSEGKKESPYGRATLLQLITFSWLNPLFKVGYKKPLDQDEIPDIDIKDSARFLSHSFDDSVKHVKERHHTRNPSIYMAIFLLIRKKAAINALFAMINAGASYVGPYLINDFVAYLSEKKNYSLNHGYIIALAFLSAKMVEVIAQRQWIFGARQLGMRLRAALISHIYKKGLHLSSQSRQSHSSGEIINYMSVDIQRITDFIWYMNTIWMLPIQISLATYILNMNVGLSSYAGLAATLLVMACNIPLTRIQKQFQSKIMEAKDDRMKATSEVLRNMKTLKLQAWDMKYLLKLENLRKIEYNWLWKSLQLSALSAFIFWGSPTFISVVTFGACILMGIPLTAGKVLSALATFRMLQDPIFSLPDLLSVVAQAKVSVDRVASYLQEDEIQEDAVMFVPRDASGVEIEIENGKFSWDTESSKPTLDGIQLTVKRGMKVAICGTVGSGKSSLLSCILGEIPKLSGKVKISGTKAYVPQSPWILTGNVRDNILFGNPYDSVKYERTIRACALTKDFELFSCGDLTEIGERGINMSGGQKQRIQIARAVYQDADIYILDDPFSAVDAHTGTQLFEDCLMGILKDKTIIYVTHQVEFLPAADLILMMQDGQIKQAGRFEELLKHNIGFEVLVGAHSEALESILNVENSSRMSQKSISLGEAEIDPPTNVQLLNGKHDSEQNLSLEIMDKGGRLTQEEEREKGSIGKEVYWSYLTLVWGGALVPIIVLAQSSFQVLQIASNYWMAWASPPTMDTEPVVGMNVLFLVYILLSVGSSLCVLVRATLVATAGILTSQKLFMNMLHSVIRAPMSFFDSTPTGRILNRASTDQSVLDLELAMRIGWCAFSIIQILGTIGVMSQVAWQVFVIFIPVTAICIWYQQYYTPTARELARLSGIQRAPILHHFAESLTGAATIRAYDQENRFIDTNLGLVDNESRPWFHNVSAMEWLSFRLNLLSNFVFAASLVVLVSLPEGIINPSIAGLAVTYGLNLNILQASVIWNLCNAENKMISVERILQYSKLTSEAPLEIEESRPPSNWPEFGKICFKNLQIRYAEQLPSVLKNINCTIPGRKKVGVVGRTGSGKSTLIQALCRTVEPREGSILIDDVDICKIGLHDLRSRLSIIPQDPTMFEGTVRGNLDPLEQFSDEEIWEALDKCQLGDIVRAKEEKLDSPVVENGENWSVGQRQLFCLGRALLKRSSILVLDEATASVDSATDGIVQKIISREFKNRTVVTIAHRIHTVIDSDLVLVLSEGRVVEYDTPSKLLEREDSFFSKLIKEYSLRSKSFNSLSNLQNVE
ncbi:ABC transporter [Macleaya cordata]|uniref:ABC transporter n=1 Tax=Macleaya cordata TaxID=56857 RepID=A0A200QWK9_MACCD|nr:ABC transporter [Macleaya cordata]